MDLGSSFLNPVEQTQRIDQSAEMFPAKLAGQLGLNRLQAAQTEHTLGLTTLNAAQAAQMSSKAAMDQRASALMAQALGTGLIPGPGGTNATMSQRLQQLAGIEAQAGNVAKAGDMMKAASAAEAHEATARAAGVRQGIDQFKSQAAQAKAIATTLDGVTDQASWDAANSRFESEFGVRSPYRNFPYDPAFVRQLKDSALSANEKANLAIKQADELSKAANRRSAMAHRTAMEDVAERRLDLARQKSTADKKVAGKDVGSPTSGESNAAERLIAGEGLAEGADLKTSAYDVASQARALRKGNPGMTMDDALRQALATKRANGDFAQGVTPPKNFLGFDIPGTGGAPTKSYEAALPYPKSGKAADLLVGKKYKDPKTGAVGVWNGKGWDKPKTSAPASSKATVPVDNAEPDDEED